MIRWRRVSGLALMAALVAASASADVGKALKKLEKQGDAFDVETFLDRVDDGDLKTVQLYLEAGMPATAADARGRTALHVAAEQADGAVARALIAAGADVNAVRESGDTPLCDAAGEEAYGAAEALVAAGANVNAVCGFGRTALHEASAENDARMIQMLLAAGATVDVRERAGETPLHLAADESDPAGTAALLAGGADPNARDSSGATPLHEAVDGRAVASLRLLLEAGADASIPYPAGDSPLERAGGYGNAEVVELLRTAPKVEAATPRVPVEMTPEEAQARLAALAIPFDDEQFFRRLEGGDLATVALFVAAGTPLSTRNPAGRPALYVAVERGRLDAVKMLLTAGADPDDAGQATNPDFESGETLVLKAVDLPDTGVLEALLAAGAPFDQPNRYGMTPLASAVALGKADMARLLIAAGANVAHEPYPGYPILWTAVSMGHTEVVRMLLDAGATAGGKRADMIASAPSPEIAALLEQAP